MKKQNRSLINSTIYIMIFLAFLAIAMATPSPSLVTTTWTNAIVNVSLGSDGDNVTFLTVFAASPTTANSSTATGKVFNITNSTATNFMFGSANFTLSNALVLEDSNDYTVSFVTTGSGTAAVQQTGTSATGVIVSRTTPTAPSAVTPSGTVTTQTNSFSSTVVAATTSRCTINFVGLNPGSAAYPMSHSGTTCSVTLSNMPKGIYSYYIRASDGVDNVDSSANTLTLNGGQVTAAKKAAVVAMVTNQPLTKEGTQKGLSIINEDASEDDGSVSEEFTGKELTKTGGGIVVGAIAGTFVLPVVGTALGAFIGGAVGIWL